jgi:hypothetical protein
MADPNLFGKVFSNATFWTWKVVAKLIDGLPLVEQREIDLFELANGRRYNRQARRQFNRLILLCGRRSGKDRFLSALAIWRAALFVNWRKHTSAGEQAVVCLLGADRRQGNILSKYCGGLLEAPMLRAEVTRYTSDTIEFKNGSSLEIATNARLIRGRSAIAVLGSECCHWKTAEHSNSSDEEVVAAAEPSLAMCGDEGLLVLGSSVYRKKGYMYRQWKALWGQDDADTLVWLATSACMNPRLPQYIIDRALSTDSARARAEYMSEWRSDLSDCFPPDAIDACTDFGTHERAPLPHMTYFAHADAAGGTGKDSFAFAISHRDSSYTIDVIREYKPRFVPAQVIAELVQLMKAYRITTIRGDKFAGGFHSSEWASHGITFEPCENSTSENYLTVLPLILANRVRLVDHKTLRSQLSSLERKPGDGRETVSHPQHDAAHDDVATSVCGAIVAAMPTSDGAYSSEIWAAVTGIGEDQQAVLQRFAKTSRRDLGDHGYAIHHHNPVTEGQDLVWEKYKAMMTGPKHG